MKLDKLTRISLGLFNSEDFEGLGDKERWVVAIAVTLVPLMLIGIMLLCGHK